MSIRALTLRYLNQHRPDFGTEHDDSELARFCFKGEQTSTSTQSNEPWAGAQPSLRTGYRAAEQNILNRPTEFFPGSTVVPFAPETTAALGATTNRALQGSPLLGQAQGYTGDVLGGQYLDPASNPFFQGTMDSIVSAIRPGVDSMFAGGGRAGSPLHAEALGRGVSRGAMPYLSNLYQQERGIMEGAAGRAPGLAREDYYDIDRLRGVGGIRQAQAGENLADSMARWGFAQEEPGRRAQAYISAISGIPTPLSSTTRTSGGGGGKGMDALGLGLQGAGTAGALGWAPFAVCWVAREVYGADNPQWLVFREWMFTQAPKWLRAAYLKHGERVACWIQGKERTKAVIRRWMDARIRRMNRS